MSQIHRGLLEMHARPPTFEEILFTTSLPCSQPRWL